MRKDINKFRNYQEFKVHLARFLSLNFNKNSWKIETISVLLKVQQTTHQIVVTNLPPTTVLTRWKECFFSFFLPFCFKKMKMNDRGQDLTGEKLCFMGMEIYFLCVHQSVSPLLLTVWILNLFFDEFLRRHHGNDRVVWIKKFIVEHSSKTWRISSSSLSLLESRYFDISAVDNKQTKNPFFSFYTVFFILFAQFLPNFLNKLWEREKKESLSL